jgi:hypothetical protein
MSAPQYIPSFYFYKFAEGISQPFTSLQAYKSGAIDEDGNVIHPETSIDPLEYLIIKLKKIFEQLPMGMTKSKLNNYMTTLQLFGEEVKHIGITDPEYQGLVEGYIALNINPNVSYIKLCEDMGSGGMGTAGTSPNYNTGSVSGYDAPMTPLQRRKPVVGGGLDNCEMFDVCPEEMNHFKSAKAWKHVPESDTKKYLQRYQRRNPKSHMAVRSTNPDTGESDLYWIQFKPMSFMEEFQLEDLSILNEENQEVNPDKNLDGSSSVAEVLKNNKKKSNAERQSTAYSAMTNLLTTKGFKHNPQAKPHELKTGEFNIFEPSTDTADIIVAHDLSGKAGHSRIEMKYQRDVPNRESTTYDVVVPRKTSIPVMGKSRRAWAPVRALGTEKGTRKYLKDYGEQVKESIPHVLKQKGGMMIVGNHNKVHLVQNEEHGSDAHGHDSALISHLGLKTTHTTEDLSKSGNPYIGNIGRVGGGKNLRLRVSAPRRVIKDNLERDTFEDQQHNANILGIPKI